MDSTYFGLEMKYFILKPRSKWYDDPNARASRQAMRAYADSIDFCDAELSAELREWARQEDELSIAMVKLKRN